MLVTASSCKEADVPDQGEPNAADVLIANEGNFGWGEGTLSLYNSASKELTTEVFKDKNSNALGNVFQSIFATEDGYLLVINNSQKIIHTNKSFELIGEITGFTSPRFIAQANDSIHYVTDLFANKLWVFNLNSHSIESTIDIQGWSENLIKVGDKVWVGNMASNKIYSIDINSHSLSDSIEVGYAQQSMKIANDNILYVLCQEKAPEKPFIARVNLVTKVVVDSLAINASYPTHLNYSESNDMLYYLDGDIYQINAKSNATPSVLIDLNMTSPYAFKLNTMSGEFYVSDAKDWASQSQVLRYSNTGTELDNFSPGIITTDFFFK
ncbi:MAG: hypothetical protein JXR19_02270 [Bacteroidia bacterium]